MDMAALGSSLEGVQRSFTDFVSGHFADTTEEPSLCSDLDFILHMDQQRACPSGLRVRRKTHLFHEGIGSFFIFSEANISKISKSVEAKKAPLFTQELKTLVDCTITPSDGISALEEKESSRNSGWIGKAAMASVQVKYALLSSLIFLRISIAVQYNHLSELDILVISLRSMYIAPLIKNVFIAGFDWRCAT